jgi:hypothetical protein
MPRPVAAGSPTDGSLAVAADGLGGTAPLDSDAPPEDPGDASDSEDDTADAGFQPKPGKVPVPF